MYTKAELIENRKLEKVLRENKYKFRNQQIKREKREKIQILVDRLFLVAFIPLLMWFLYQVIAYLYVRL